MAPDLFTKLLYKEIFKPKDTTLAKEEEVIEDLLLSFLHYEITAGLREQKIAEKRKRNQL